MPEIPEMELYKRYLTQSVVGRSITRAAVIREKSINVTPAEFAQWTEGAVTHSVDREGKNIVMFLSSGKALLAHMMLDGRIYLETAGENANQNRQTHISLKLSNEDVLRFCEMRLGYVKLVTPEEIDYLINDLGIDPLAESFTQVQFLNVINPKRGMVKPLLMDQRVIAGIGNAYSNEILFNAGILPERRIPTLSLKEKEKMFTSIPEILRAAIEKGGYIEEKFAVWDKLSGGVNEEFKVYDRAGENCYTCGQRIEQKVVGGRNAYFCNTCQT